MNNYFMSGHVDLNISLGSGFAPHVSAHSCQLGLQGVLTLEIRGGLLPLLNLPNPYYLAYAHP